MRNNDIKLPILRSQIETAIGHSVVTPKDFDSLRDMIFSRLHIYVSSTTLKRIWGYLNDDVTPHQSTLNILARYLGYVDFEAFANGDVATDGELASNPIMSRRIDVDEQLESGDRIHLATSARVRCAIPRRQRFRGNRVAKHPP